MSSPRYGEVGYRGDIEELREYPCNCYACRADYERSLEPHAPPAPDGPSEGCDGAPARRC